MSPTRTLISASRRTDIPRFFGDRFREQRRLGFADWRTAYGQTGRVSLADADVLGFVFWTRDARPFRDELKRLRAVPLPYAFQFTITGYDRSWEPRRPELQAAIESFQEVAANLPGPEAIEWRYDPIVISDSTPPEFHEDAFGRIAQALTGHTRRVNISLIEPYAKVLTRIPDPSVAWRPVAPEKQARLLVRHPDLRWADRGAQELVTSLARIASSHGMELRSCSSPELGPAPASCIGPQLFSPYGPEITQQVAAIKKAPSRPDCLCRKVVDIGQVDTCRAGCRYCYALTTPKGGPP